MNLKDMFEEFRPSPQYPTYPPYHKGLYLEDYFYDWYYKNKINSSRILIPVSWTTCYIDKKTAGLQDKLNALDKGKRYFTVCQHDDGIKESLPPDTVQFNAGGNSGGIPIPLVCSMMDIIRIGRGIKTYLCSFVGSFTHDIRRQMLESFKNCSSCKIVIKNWSPSVQDDQLATFIEAALQSKFLLCPRGYGLNSFRLYESFQLGCVPVIITDKLFLPWEDELNWSDFSVIIDKENVGNIKNILENIDETIYDNMLSFGQMIFSDYFTLEGVCNQIVKRIK